ncbi:MAG: hemolysin family protein [Bacteroidales bacterium]|nr:hemolysin family protein [Bacteroidales bacterium]
MLAANITILAVMLLLSAFFSGSEMAFLASNKLLIEIGRQKHPRVTSIIDIFNSNPSLLIATILVGNNVTMVIYGLVFSDTVGPALSNYISSPTLTLLAQTIISTIIIIVTAEFLPKSLIQINPSTMLYVVAVPLFFFYIIFYPLSVVMQKASSFVIKYILRTRSEEQPQSLLPGRVDFDNLVSMQAEKNPDDSEVGLEAKLMRNALDFSKIKVRDCYIPRTDMVAININESVDHLHKKFVSSGYSKILVFNGSIDNIVGYVHVSEMFKGSKSIRSMMSPIAVVPETMRANLLLKQFTSQHKSIAIVVDEFGGTSGLITLEDVLEEIFGEINDEHDDDDLIDERLDDETYVFSGRMEVDDINEKYGVHLPTSDDYDTLAGLILSETQSIPREGDVVEVDRFEFKVLQAGHTTVDKIQMRVKD